jgi:hypothetical protein
VGSDLMSVRAKLFYFGAVKVIIKNNYCFCHPNNKMEIP